MIWHAFQSAVTVRSASHVREPRLVWWDQFCGIMEFQPTHVGMIRLMIHSHRQIRWAVSSKVCPSGCLWNSAWLRDVSVLAHDEHNRPFSATQPFWHGNTGVIIYIMTLFHLNGSGPWCYCGPLLVFLLFLMEHECCCWWAVDKQFTIKKLCLRCWGHCLQQKSDMLCFSFTMVPSSGHNKNYNHIPWNK